MKTKIALIIAGCLMLTACDSDVSREAVGREFKTSDVTNYQNQKFHFIVRAPDNSVWLVECMKADDAVISKRVMIFGPKP